MSKIEELQKQTEDHEHTRAKIASIVDSRELGVSWVGGQATKLGIDAELRALLSATDAKLAAEIEANQALLAKAEAVLNPPPEPTIFDTPNTWFPYSDTDTTEMEDRGGYYCIAVCTGDAWDDYVKRGKQDGLKHYGNCNGAQCASQIVDACNDIAAGLDVSGNPCNAVIIIKRVE